MRRASAPNGRERSRKLHLDDSDIRNYQADPETFHLTVMLGAGGIDGGMAGICNQLKVWTRRRLHPDRRGLLAAKAARRLRRLSGRIRLAVPRPPRQRRGGRGRRTHPDARGDGFAGRMGRVRVEIFRSIERYAGEQPDDPDVPAMLKRIRRWRDAYLRWGRDTLGFAVYLFHRPGRAEQQEQAANGTSLRASREPGALRLVPCATCGAASPANARGSRRLSQASSSGFSSSAISSHSASSRASCQVRSPCRARRSLSASLRARRRRPATRATLRPPFFRVERGDIDARASRAVGERLPFRVIALPRPRLGALLRFAVTAIGAFIRLVARRRPRARTQSR